MTQPAASSLLAAMLLAACSGAPDEADYNRVEVPEREARAAAAIERAAAQNGTATTARLGVPVSSPTPQAGRARVFPTAFEGYWGATPGDCELANIAATGRIAVERDTIRFYESRARVQSLSERSPYEVTTELRFSGEGESWARQATWRLEQGGTTLIRSESASATAPARVVRYQRC